MNKTLGVDISSSSTGYAVNEDGTIIDAGFIVLPHDMTMIDKAKYIVSVLPLEDIDTINIEAPLMSFAEGKTNAFAMMTLAQINGMVQYALSDRYNINIINVLTARKMLFGKAKIKGMNGKEYVKMELEKKYNYITQFYKMNTRGNEDKRNEDLRDAVVMALYVK